MCASSSTVQRLVSGSSEGAGGGTGIGGEGGEGGVGGALEEMERGEAFLHVREL